MRLVITCGVPRAGLGCGCLVDCSPPPESWSEPYDTDRIASQVALSPTVVPGVRQ